MTSSTTETLSSTSAGKPKRKPGWWYPWIFVAFFGVVISVNGIMIFHAYNSWTGLETKDHYLKGLAYDSNIEGAKAQEALGWTVKLTVTTNQKDGEKRNISYQTSFMDHNGQPVQDLKAHAFFLRPTHEGVDVDGPAPVREAGVVGGKFNLAHPGNWEVRIHAESQGRQYQHVERVVVD